MDLVKIKEIDGIPCIILPENIFGFKDEDEPKKEFNSLNITNDFTDILQLKGRSNIGNMLEELKKKFKEKKQ